jgi:hypothetical protein
MKNKGANIPFRKLDQEGQIHADPFKLRQLKLTLMLFIANNTRDLAKLVVLFPVGLHVNQISISEFSAGSENLFSLL